MDDSKMKAQVQQVFGDTLSGVQEDPWLARWILTAAQEPWKRRWSGKSAAVLVIVLVLVLTATVGIAWSVSRQYFTEIAQMTVTSGDYEDWSPEEKRYMVQIMGKYGLIPEGEARRVVRLPEGEIDAFMLARYGAKSAPGDMGWISINRIAMVELGDYTRWPNETWVWYTEMMLEIGLWDRTNDIDLFYTPGAEAVPPEEAVRSAREHLLDCGVPAEKLDAAQVIWHYMTDSADTEMANLSYWVTFVYGNQSEDTVRVLKDGETSCAFCQHGV